jgi:hypothetical protein
MGDGAEQVFVDAEESMIDPSFLISLLVRLLPRRRDAEPEEGGEDTGGEGPFSQDTVDAGEIVWDLSSTACHAELFLRHGAVGVCLHLVEHPDASNRLVEIGIGVLANMAAHPALCNHILGPASAAVSAAAPTEPRTSMFQEGAAEAMGGSSSPSPEAGSTVVSTNGLLRSVLGAPLLLCNDAGVLTEALRLWGAALRAHATTGEGGWLRRASDPDALARLNWIGESSTDGALLAQLCSTLLCAGFAAEAGHLTDPVEEGAPTAAQWLYRTMRDHGLVTSAVRLFLEETEALSETEGGLAAGLRLLEYFSTHADVDADAAGGGGGGGGERSGGELHMAALGPVLQRMVRLGEHSEGALESARIILVNCSDQWTPDTGRRSS